MPLPYFMSFYAFALWSCCRDTIKEMQPRDLYSCSLSPPFLYLIIYIYIFFIVSDLMKRQQKSLFYPLSCIIPYQVHTLHISYYLTSLEHIISWSIISDDFVSQSSSWTAYASLQVVLFPSDSRVCYKFRRNERGMNLISSCFLGCLQILLGPVLITSISVVVYRSFQNLS